MMAGAVALIYNLPEIGSYQLVLSRSVIVNIYELNIKYWNDTQIQQINPEVASLLPNVSIILLHRSDQSGTAYILSKAIKSFSPESIISPGMSPDWPGENMASSVEVS
jgi:phosphate transport system substrate-binding protein